MLVIVFLLVALPCVRETFPTSLIDVILVVIEPSKSCAEKLPVASRAAAFDGLGNLIVPLPPCPAVNCILKSERNFFVP